MESIQEEKATDIVAGVPVVHLEVHRAHAWESTRSGSLLSRAMDFGSGNALISRGTTVWRLQSQAGDYSLVPWATDFGSRNAPTCPSEEI